MLHRGSRCSLMQIMDGHITHCEYHQIMAHDCKVLLNVRVGIISISRYRDINRQLHMATISYDRLHLRYWVNTNT